jgi:hypothetical protein
MVAAVWAHLVRFFEVARIEVSFAAFALNEHVLGLYNAFFEGNVLNSLSLFAEPGHQDAVSVYEVTFSDVGGERRLPQNRKQKAGDRRQKVAGGRQ